MTFSPKVWGDALHRLQDEIPDFAFDAWITPLSVKVAGDRLILGCPNSFHRDRVRSHHFGSIERCWREARGEAAPEALEPEAAADGDFAHGAAAIELLTMHEFTAAAGHEIDAHAIRQGTVEMRKVGVVSTARAVNGPDATASTRPAKERGGATAADLGRPSGVPGPPGLRAVPKTCSLASVPPVRNESIASPGSPGEAPGTDTTARLELGLDGDSAGADRPLSFETFIVGPCNALAREAALALARRRQRSLNQLYLGGSSGMGKTHLARATADEARLHALGSASTTPARPGARARRHPRAGSRVIYTSAEQFTSEFVSAMRNGRNEEWTRRYRGAIDLLVVEDIQFFLGRTKTQQELFHTIDHVLDSGGRVLLTGDRAPRDLTGLDERMRAQVGRGFVAELDRPDPLVRRHILRAKAAAGGVHLPADCLDLLVEATEASDRRYAPSADACELGGGSVRDLEGVLIQVVTTASLLGRSIDLALTQEAIDLKSGAGSSLPPPRLEVGEVVRIVASFFGKRPEALASRSRRRDVLIPRQLAMYLAQRYTDASLTEIGRALGRDHPSVRNAITRIERQVLENAPIRYQVEALSERIDRSLEGDKR